MRRSKPPKLRYSVWANAIQSGSFNMLINNSSSRKLSRASLAELFRIYLRAYFSAKYGFAYPQSNQFSNCSSRGLYSRLDIQRCRFNRKVLEQTLAPKLDLRVDIPARLGRRNA